MLFSKTKCCTAPLLDVALKSRMENMGRSRNTWNKWLWFTLWLFQSHQASSQQVKWPPQYMAARKSFSKHIYEVPIGKTMHVKNKSLHSPDVTWTWMHIWAPGNEAGYSKVPPPQSPLPVSMSLPPVLLCYRAASNSIGHGAQSPPLSTSFHSVLLHFWTIRSMLSLFPPLCHSTDLDLHCPTHRSREAGRLQPYTGHCEQGPDKKPSTKNTHISPKSINSSLGSHQLK